MEASPMQVSAVTFILGVFGSMFAIALVAFLDYILTLPRDRVL